MIYNPYAILGVKQVATKEEIKEALKKQIERNCGTDENRKNADGECLQSVFLNAAEILLDPKRRAEVDKKLKYGIILYEKDAEWDRKNEEKSTQSSVEAPLPSKDSVIEVKNHKITYINTKLLFEPLKITKSSLFLGKKIHLKKLYAVIGADSSFMFVKEKKGYYNNGAFVNSKTFAGYHLENVFTDENCFENGVYNGIYRWENRPYTYEKEFYINGVKSIALMGSKFIPIDLVYNKKISVANLKQVSNYMSQYLIHNPQIIEEIFGAKRYKK